MSESKAQTWKSRWNFKGEIQAARELQNKEDPDSEHELPKSLADSLSMHCENVSSGPGKTIEQNKQRPEGN